MSKKNLVDFSGSTSVDHGNMLNVGGLAKCVTIVIHFGLDVPVQTTKQSQRITRLGIDDIAERTLS